MATLIDSNVLLDVITDDVTWATWSANAILLAAGRGALTINPVVYAEVSVRFASIVSVDAVLADLRIQLVDMPREALFLAGKAHGSYRRRGGTRTGVLSDFFIGAHAAVTGLPLLTRDPRRYRQDFPSVALISP